MSSTFTTAGPLDARPAPSVCARAAPGNYFFYSSHGHIARRHPGANPQKLVAFACHAWMANQLVVPGAHASRCTGSECGAGVRGEAEALPFLMIRRASW